MDISQTALVRLKLLVEEERILESLLHQVRSKYLNLQVEHMALSKAQKTVLEKYNECQDYSTSQIIPVDVIDQQYEIIKSDSRTNNLETVIIKEVSGMSFDDNEILPVQVETDDLFWGTVHHEEGLDDPLVINQLKLDNIQTATQYSESESSDENMVI